VCGIDAKIKISILVLHMMNGPLGNLDGQVEGMLENLTQKSKTVDGFGTASDIHFNSSGIGIGIIISH
jgi:hypothetical protein